MVNIDQALDLCQPGGASQNGHNSIVELLLRRGECNGARMGSTALNSPNNDGRIPLHFAVGNGHDSTVELLLKCGSTALDSPDKCGRTPLHYAARNGHDSTIELLLRYGSTSLNSPDNNGWTPLHFAASRGHDSAVKIFKAMGGTILHLKNLISWQVEKLQEFIPEDEILEIRSRIYFVRALVERLLYPC